MEKIIKLAIDMKAHMIQRGEKSQILTQTRREIMNRIMSSIMAVVVVLCMTLGIPGWATATVILDQQNVIPIPGNYQTDMSSQQTLGTFSQFAQTFTVGVGGTLVRVDVEVFHEQFTNGNATVHLVTTTGAGLPDSTALAAWTITRAGSSDTVGSFVSHDLGAAAFPVSPGQIYAIEFTWFPPQGQTFSGFDWVRGVSDTYAGGDAFFSTFGVNPTPWTPNALWPDPYDYGFRTFVDVQETAIPEPTTMLLLGSGLIGLAGYGRKKLFKK